MGKSNQPDLPCLQKYGVPFYSAAWVPCKELRSKLQPPGDDEDSTSKQSTPAPLGDSDKYYVVLAGGGGEGRNGIPNAVVIARYDFASNSLSSQPVAKLGLGSDLPYRMAVHHGGDGLICAMSKSCRFFEWDEIENDEAKELGVKESEEVLNQLEDVGQQLAIAFNNDNSVLAVGGEDGHLRIFKWPSMETIVNEDQAHASVKDLCFSHDGKFLVSLGSRGPGRVWDLSSLAAVASLPKNNDEVFASCRFSHTKDGTQILYVAAITDKGGSITTWNTNSWTRTSSKHISREPVSSFNVSPEGKLFAIGTVQGDVLIVSSTNMRVQMMVKNAHVGIVTALDFSHDSRALISASMDSSARVTLVEDKKSGGPSSWIIILVILIVILAYLIKNKELQWSLGEW